MTKGIKYFFNVKTIRIVLFCAIWLLVLGYRFVIIKDYCSKYTDDDQALLWFGARLAEHFAIVEPHFLGQAYGSMLESIVAVPLQFILGGALNWAVPIATTLLSLIPLWIFSIYMVRKNEIIAFSIAILPLTMRVDCDVLMSIPRSFIPGFIFGVIGVVLFIDLDKCYHPIKSFFGMLAFGVAYITSETTITIIAIAVLWLCLYNLEGLKNNWKPLTLGGAIAIGLVLYCNYLFYVINPDYLLHGTIGGHESFSVSVFTSNIPNMKSLFSAFSCMEFKGLPIVLIIVLVGLVLYAIRCRNYKMLLVNFCACLGTILFLAFRKTLDYKDGLLFSQTRMFLFIPYVVAELIFLSGVKVEKNLYCSDGIKAKASCIINMLVTVCAVILFVGKIIAFNDALYNMDDLYKSDIVGLYNCEDIYRSADEIRQLAIEKDVKIVVTLSNSKGPGYATGAINYDAYDSYNAFFDRRTQTYLKYKNMEIAEHVLFVNFTGGNIESISCEYIEGNLIDWIKENKGIQRLP